MFDVETGVLFWKLKTLTSVTFLKFIDILSNREEPVRHSRESGNPVYIRTVTGRKVWTPAYAGVTRLFT